MSKRIQARRFCFTSFNDEEWFILQQIGNVTEVVTDVDGNTNINVTPLKENIEYLICGIETCPTTNKIHFQCYIELKKPKDLNWLKKNGLSKAHIEPCKGDQKSNIDYCTKSNHYFEFGTPKSQGKRTDLETTAKKILNGATLEEIKEESPEMIIKYHKGLQILENMSFKPEIKEKQIFVHWGVAGGGKSHKVFNDNDINQIYKVKYGNSGTWFDGYDTKKHKVVLFDEFVGQVKLQNLLEYLDKYPVQVEYKGGTKYFQPDKIYICSNKHPKDWYNWESMKPELKQALYRRIQGKLTHFEKKYNEQPIINDDDL